MRRAIRLLVAGAYLCQIAFTDVLAAPPDAAAETDGAQQVALSSVSIEGDSISMELSQLMPYEVFTLTYPYRLVIEFPGTTYKAGFDTKAVDSSLIRRVRGYQFKENPSVTRVVLDLKTNVDYRTMVDNNVITLSVKKSAVVLDDTARQSAPSATKSIRSPESADTIAGLPKEPVTLDFENADIRDVIRLMAETSNTNIIFGSEISGNVTVHLKKVPFDQAFTTVLNMRGLVASQLGGNIVRVTTPDALLKDRSKAIVFTRNIPVNYLKASEMAKHLQAIMAVEGRKGTITIMEENNSLVVTDTEEGLAQADRLISQLDKRPQQVMIEARIVEINLNNGLDMGVQWEFANINDKNNAAGVARRNYFGQLDRDGGARVTNEAAYSGGSGSESLGAKAPGSGGTGVSLPGPTSAGITFGFVKNASAFSATLAALVTKSRAKILSAPKVVTVNGKEAKIEAVQDIAFRTSTVTGTGVVSNSFVNVSAGISLTVTPVINAEDRVTLTIKPVSSFPTQQSTEAGPIIRTRSAQTTVIIRDGDTLVIGGLIDDQDTKGISKVPLLGDIPIIGIFFRSQTSSKSRNELLVFVTPRVVRD